LSKPLYLVFFLSALESFTFYNQQKEEISNFKTQLDILVGFFLVGGTRGEVGRGV